MTAPGAITMTIDPGAVRVVAAPPLRVSQHTCLGAIGVKSRPFLESLAAYEAAGGEVLRLGRTRMVEPEPYLRWLAAREAASATPTDDGDAASDEELLASLGLRAV